MSTITWLHLSDLHMREKELYNQKVVIDALLEDIGKQINEGLKPNFIIFSGDIAFSGKLEEYKLAIKHLFVPLLNLTGLSVNSLFVIPGNHDVDWDHIDDFIASGMSKLLDGSINVSDFFVSKNYEQYRKQAFRKFEAYTSFLDLINSQIQFNENEYFFSKQFELSGRMVRITGLNSSWMCGIIKDTSNNPLDQGNLLIGEPQLRQVFKKKVSNDNVINIALIHHPADWLHERDRSTVTKRLRAEVDFVLHGHLHETDVEIRQGSTSNAIFIPTGSLYSKRDYANGYNFVRVDLESNEIKIYLRRYEDLGSEGKPAWMKDIRSTGEEADGVIKLGLPVKKNKNRPDKKIPTKRQRKKILCVENEEPSQRILLSLLEEYYDVDIIKNDEDAIKQLDNQYDLVIVNLHLENDNDYKGELVLQALKARGMDDTPRIVVTGKSADMDELVGLRNRYSVSKIFYKGSTFKKVEFMRAVHTALQ